MTKITEYQRTALREMEHRHKLLNDGLHEATATCRRLEKMGLAQDRGPHGFWITTEGISVIHA